MVQAGFRARAELSPKSTTYPEPSRNGAGTDGRSVPAALKYVRSETRGQCGKNTSSHALGSKTSLCASRVDWRMDQA